MCSWAAGNGTFETSSNYQPGGNPIGVVAGDFNGDGRMDVATANYSNHTVTVLTGVAAKPLPEDPADSGLRSGYGRGNLSVYNVDADYWSFTAEAGDRLTVAAENPGNPSSSGLSYTIYRPDGTSLGSFTTDSLGRGQLAPLVMPVSGTYYVRVTYNWSYEGEYRLRVTLAEPSVSDGDRGEQQYGRGQLADAGGQRAESAGDRGRLHRLGDPGDFYLLGNLTGGTTITLGLAQPATSGLTGELAIFKGDAVVAMGTDPYTIPLGEDGTYYARVTAGSGTAGLQSQYLLSIDVADLLSPFVTGDTLPAEGSTISSVSDRFNLTYSEDMLASTVNSSASYDLREAGSDGVFDTADDVPYTVVTRSTYSSGLTALYRVSDGPLQPGHYRFTATTVLTDKVGNALDPEFSRTFFVQGVPLYVLENRSNDTQATATPLGDPQLAADGSFTLTSSRGVGSNPYFVTTGDVDGDGHLDLVTANYSSSTVSVLLGQRGRHDSTGSTLRYRQQPDRGGGGRPERRRPPGHRGGQLQCEHGQRAAAECRRDVRREGRLRRRVPAARHPAGRSER
jgi:hypothetical protein